MCCKIFAFALIALFLAENLEAMPVPSQPAPADDSPVLAGGYGQKNPVLLARRTNLALIGFALAGGGVLLSGSQSDLAAGAGVIMIIAGVGITGYTCFLEVEGETPAEASASGKAQPETSPEKPGPEKPADDSFPELEYGEPERG